jgi:GT2 family glycosyltransferase
VILVAYGDEPRLVDAVESAQVRSANDPSVEVVVVDNGLPAERRRALEGRAGVRVVGDGTNLGFADGANLGAERSTGRVVVFLNQDASLRPGCLRHLADAARRPGVGLATASVRLADHPDLLNSAGNVLNVFGHSWAGHLGEPAAAAGLVESDVLLASGCCFAVSRAVWDDLGGFFGPLFMYYEDAELSLRAHLYGLTVRYVPDAVVLHHYRTNFGAWKIGLADRNRRAVLLTTFRTRTLLLLSPLLVVAEIGSVAHGIVHRHLRATLGGWRWLLRHRRVLAAHRRTVQHRRRTPDASILARMSTALPPLGPSGPVSAGLERALRPVQRFLIRIG